MARALFLNPRFPREHLPGRNSIVQLAGRSHAAKPVPKTTVDGVILDSIETTDVVELGPERVALKAWEELRFTPMLEALGMNPSAIATAQLMVFNGASSSLGAAQLWERTLTLLKAETGIPDRKNRNPSVKRLECLWNDPLGFMRVCGRSCETWVGLCYPSAVRDSRYSRSPTAFRFGYYSPMSSFQSSGLEVIKSRISAIHSSSWQMSTATPWERTYSSGPWNVLFSPITTFGMP